MRYTTKVLVLFIAFCSHDSLSQNTFSPYTINGIGDLSGMSLSSHFAMGEVGIGTPSVWHINNLNPALLPYNTLTTFQLGIGAESRTVSSQTETQRSGTGGIRYMAFSFPLIPSKWTSSFGFLPYSSVNYNVTANDVVEGTTIPLAYNFKGQGGITQVYFSNGFNLTKGLTVGFKTSFLFGFVENETITNLGNADFFAPLAAALFEKTDYRGFKASGGIAYRKKIIDKKFFNVGFTYEKSSDLNGTRLLRLERRDAAGTAFPGDTLVNNEKGAFSLPSELGLGFSFEKLNRYTISFDIKQQRWNQFAGLEGDSEEFQNSLFAGLGMEFIPDYTSVNSYFNRVRYRFGFSYQQLPYVINGNTINDFGINFGWTLPFNVVSGMDFGFKLGQRGTKSNDLIRERYFKFVIGATINDKWFGRRKYD
ncbi:MAG: hypothetical protein ACJA2S_000020 [Cyclobacteriaceae bacterium]|jgi:hypothetical protein